MFDEEIMRAAAEVARRYPRGMVPGEHPAEILGGIHRGFTRIQLNAINTDEKMRHLVRRALDEVGVTPALAEIANVDDQRGRAHRALLASVGHPLHVEIDPVEIDRVVWLILADAPQAMVSKSQPAKETTRWTIPDAHTQSEVVVNLDDGYYEVGVVPEAGTGECFLLVRWADQQEVERHPVTITAREPLILHLQSFGRTLYALAFVPKDDPR